MPETTRVSVDLLITGADIVCLDKGGTVVADGAIAITGNRLHWIGDKAEAAGKRHLDETVIAHVEPAALFDVVVADRLRRSRRAGGAVMDQRALPLDSLVVVYDARV